MTSLALRNTRNSDPRWRSTDAGPTAVGSNGSIRMCPAAISFKNSSCVSTLIHSPYYEGWRHFSNYGHIRPLCQLIPALVRPAGGLYCVFSRNAEYCVERAIPLGGERGLPRRDPLRRGIPVEMDGGTGRHESRSEMTEGT